MNDYAGESGGGSSAPLPTVEYEAVEMDTASVKAFGDALIKDAENMMTASKDIKDQLVNPAAGERGAETTYAVGADPRQETLHSIVVEHSQRMDDTQVLLKKARISLHNAGLICQAIATQLGDVDALNGTSVDQVKNIIGDATKKPSEDV